MSELSRSFDDGLRVTSVAAKALDQEVLAVSLENVGPLSAVALQIVEIIDSPSASASLVSAEVGRDPVIAAKVLSVANSAFYGNAVVSNLQAAVARLGLRTLRNLVLAAAVSDRSGFSIERYPFTENGLWQHSLTVALLAQKNGIHLTSLSDRSDDLFLGGLLHDIGKVITSQLLDFEVSSTGFTALYEEIEGAGFSHIDAGVLVAKEWTLPDTVTNVILGHHDLRKIDRDVELVAAIALFDVIANKHFLGLDPAASIDEMLPRDALEALLLTDNDFMELEHSIEGQLKEITEIVEALV